MKKILVAIDGSQQAAAALRMGAELARRLGSELRIVHALPRYDGAADPWFEPFERAAEENARGMLDQAVSGCGVEAGKVSAEILHGAPAESVADEAERWPADVVVVGSRGQHAVARVLMGSVSDRLVHICAKPVLVVR
jgi:nucleotide-binding universal stress UspA family protein